jgi:hypothetical protein
LALPDESAFGQAIRQLDRAVMSNVKPLGDLADGGIHIVRNPFQCQEQLMMLGIDSFFPRGFFTEV